MVLTIRNISLAARVGGDLAQLVVAGVLAQRDGEVGVLVALDELGDALERDLPVGGEAAEQLARERVDAQPGRNAEEVVLADQRGGVAAALPLLLRLSGAGAGPAATAGAGAGAAVSSAAGSRTRSTAPR